MVQVKWEPFRDLMAMQDRMTRIFDETLTRIWKAEGMARAEWSPPVDIRETAEVLILDIDLPGLSQNEIDVKVEENILTIQGVRKFVKEAGENYVQIERPYGSFRRIFTLSGKVDQDNIKANYKEGVLRVVLHKKGAAKPRQIFPEEE
jgi:HSP20 family protein